MAAESVATSIHKMFCKRRKPGWPQQMPRSWCLGPLAAATRGKISSRGLCNKGLRVCGDVLAENPFDRHRQWKQLKSRETQLQIVEQRSKLRLHQLRSVKVNPWGAKTAADSRSAGRGAEESEAAEHSACDARQALRRARSNPERRNRGAGILHTRRHARLDSTPLHHAPLDSTRLDSTPLRTPHHSTPHHSIPHSTPYTSAPCSTPLDTIYIGTIFHSTRHHIHWHHIPLDTMLHSTPDTLPV